MKLETEAKDSIPSLLLSFGNVSYRRITETGSRNNITSPSFVSKHHLKVVQEKSINALQFLNGILLKALGIVEISTGYQRASREMKFSVILNDLNYVIIG